MFVETITQPADEFHEWSQRLRILEDPPEALIAAISWANRDGTVTGVNLWDSPEAVGDFWLERVRPVVEAVGEPQHKPTRLGAPVAVYLRERVEP